MKNIKIISVGGSIISPKEPDTEFLAKFVKMLADWLEKNDDGSLILIAGGGGPARAYQKAYHAIEPQLADANIHFVTKEESDEAADWIGVMATRLNAELLRACLGTLAPTPVVTNPTEAPDDWQGRVLVAAGWKPGFSSDNDAVLLAEKYGADTVINLSNIEKVCDADPNKNPDAKPLDRISWRDFRKMVGDAWEPGKNTPFDPIASRRAEELDLTVICAGGRSIENTRKILDGTDFVGTTISS